MLQNVGVVAVGRNFEAERKLWKMVMGEIDLHVPVHNFNFRDSRWSLVLEEQIGSIVKTA